MWESRDLLLEFWEPPIISRKPLQLETSNLARRRTAVLPKEMQNYVKRGHVGSRDPLLEFWDPLISRERLKRETSNLARSRIDKNCRRVCS